MFYKKNYWLAFGGVFLLLSGFVFSRNWGRETMTTIQTSSGAFSSIADSGFISSGEVQEMTDEVLEVAVSGLKSTPFRTMKGVAHDFWNLLGYNQAEAIMSQYNAWTWAFDPKASYEHLVSLKFPLKYPYFKKYVPENLSELLGLLKLNLSPEELKNPNILVVAQTQEGVVLAYYQEGKLKLLTSASPGTPKTKTVQGKFFLKHANVAYRSRTYGSPMPYAIRIKWPYFLHQAEVDGTFLSHGCIRIPGLYQKWLYEHLPNESVQKSSHIPAPMIIVHDLYRPTLFRYD